MRRSSLLSRFCSQHETGIDRSAFFARIGNVRIITAALGMAPALVAVLTALLAALILQPSPALAQCTYNAATQTETCTSNLSGPGTAVFSNPSPAITTLDVNSINAGQGPGQVLLAGTGATPGNGADQSLTGACDTSAGGSCTFGIISGSWPASGSEDTELRCLMEPEVDHGATPIYARVQV
jgi:hypothetical protein